MIFFWVAGYGAVYTAAQWLAEKYIQSAWVVPGSMAVYCMLLFLWSFRQGAWENIGLNPVNRRAFFRYPGTPALAVLPVYHMLTGDISIGPASNVVFVLSTVLVEELFFRGYLLHYLKKRGAVQGVIAASAVFGLMHGANLFSGSDAGYVVLQIAVAFLTGICYSAETLTLGSILPGATAHFVVNLTAESNDFPGIGWLILIEGIWSVWLCCDIRKREKEAQNAVAY